MNITKKTIHPHLHELDLMRGMAILGVIVVHIFNQSLKIHETNGTKLLLVFIWSISQSAVPLFLCISGFSLFSKYGTEFKAGVFYKNRFQKILPPYFFFSAFYFFVICHLPVNQNASSYEFILKTVNSALVK